MSNSQIKPTAKAAWRPIDVLQNPSFSGAMFLQDDYSKARTARFKEWGPEHVVSPTLSTEKTSSQAAELKKSLDLEVSSPLSKIDTDKFEKEVADAYQKGLTEGIAKGKVEGQELFNQLKADDEKIEAEQVKKLLQEISEATWALRENPVSLFEPLKRLSIHIAEQLMLTELTISSASIQSLIEQCIETLDIANSAQALVELSPSDLALIQNKISNSEEMKSWRLQADPTLLPGSVRVSANDALVTNLVEHRLESLAQSLLSNSNQWHAQSSFQPERLSARRGLANTIEDALPHASSLQEESSIDNSFDELEDVLDATPTESIAAFKNMSDLELPDLELPAKLVDTSSDQPDAAHE